MPSAVIVRTSLPAGLERLRRRGVADSADGLPAHLTMLYPFADPERLTQAVRRALAEVARRHASFDYRLRRKAIWPDTIYVAVEPTTPFARLQRDLQGAFPAFPIYGRNPSTFRFVPHVTVAEGARVRHLPASMDAEWRALPQSRRAAAIEVIANGRDGRWRTVWRLRLGDGDQAVDRMRS